MANAADQVHAASADAGGTDQEAEQAAANLAVNPRPARHLIRAMLRVTGFHGVTLPPLGVFVLAERMGDEVLIRHEQAHWAQYERMGAVKFYAAYLWYTLRYGYTNNPLEREARAAEIA